MKVVTNDKLDFCILKHRLVVRAAMAQYKYQIVPGTWYSTSTWGNRMPAIPSSPSHCAKGEKRHQLPRSIYGTHRTGSISTREHLDIIVNVYGGKTYIIAYIEAASPSSLIT